MGLSFPRRRENDKKEFLAVTPTGNFKMYLSPFCNQEGDFIEKTKTSYVPSLGGREG
jgi:hypothetical protein